ncbi:WD40 repeat-like protein, partial [Lepidopterella palustris CBS 459.81]
TLEGHSDSVLTVVLSPDGSRLASGSYNNSVRVWNVSTGKVEQTLRGHSDSILSVAFSPDGSRLVSGSSDNTVRVWNVVIGQVEQTLRGHSDLVLSVADSHSFYTVNNSMDWVFRNGSRILYLPFDYRPAEFATEGSTVATGTKTGRVAIIGFRPDVEVGNI